MKKQSMLIIVTVLGFLAFSINGVGAVSNDHQIVQNGAVYMLRSINATISISSPPYLLMVRSSSISHRIMIDELPFLRIESRADHNARQTEQSDCFSLGLGHDVRRHDSERLMLQQAGSHFEARFVGD